jgi:hypothetical protein
MKMTLANETVNVSQETLGIFLSTNKEHINMIPFAGSWTIGQVGEHILKFSSWILKSLEGPVKPTHRDSGEKIVPIEKVFLDFNSKLKSPDFIAPSEGLKNGVLLFNSLDDRMERIINIAATEDLNLTCTSEELPGFGEMTRLEWINFYNCHTKRHIHQLNKIKKVLDY